MRFKIETNNPDGEAYWDIAAAAWDLAQAAKAHGMNEIDVQVNSTFGKSIKKVRIYDSKEETIYKFMRLE